MGLDEIHNIALNSFWPCVKRSGFHSGWEPCDSMTLVEQTFSGCLAFARYLGLGVQGSIVPILQAFTDLSKGNCVNMRLSLYLMYTGKQL